MKYFTRLIALILLFSLSACVWQGKIKPDPQKVTYRQLLEHHNRWQNSIHTISGQIRLSVESEQFSGELAGSIQINDHDSLLLDLEGPLGLKMGTLFIASQRFVYYNQMTNQFISDQADETTLQKVLNLPFSLQLFSDLFFARDRFKILRKEQYQAREGQFFLAVTNGSYRFNLWFDPALWLINKVECLAPDSTLLYTKRYELYKKHGSLYFPHRITFVPAGGKQALAIYYQRLAINKPLDQEAFVVRIPDSARQIDIHLMEKN